MCMMKKSVGKLTKGINFLAVTRQLESKKKFQLKSGSFWMDWYLYYIRANNFVYIRSERAAAANSTQKRNMFQINFIYFVELSQVMPWATSIVSLSSRESDVVAIVACGNRCEPFRFTPQCNGNMKRQKNIELKSYTSLNTSESSPPAGYRELIMQTNRKRQNRHNSTTKRTFTNSLPTAAEKIVYKVIVNSFPNSFLTHEY